MKAFLALVLLATAVVARPQGYGGQSAPAMSYGGNSYQYQPATSQAYSGPSQTYSSQPVTYVAPTITFHPPEIKYSQPSITYSTPHQVPVSMPVQQSYSSGGGYNSGASYGKKK